MSGESESSNVSRRRFLAVAGSAAAATTLAGGKELTSALSLPPPPPSPPDYPVTVDITNPKHIKYHTPTQNDASVIDNVAAGKTFRWVVTPASRYRVTILLYPTTPFADGSGKPVYAFHGSESVAILGTIAASASGLYKCYVGVFDDATGLSYSDDPKIIVGSGGVPPARFEMASAVGNLKDAVSKLSSRPALQKQVESIEHKLEHLTQELK